MKSPDLNQFVLGPRLTLTFAILIALILGGNGLLLWQFHIARQQTDRLNAVSQQVISVLRLQTTLVTFHQRMDALAQIQNAPRMIAESGPLRQNLLTQTQRARDAVSHFPADIPIDPAFLATIDSIEVTLPSQLEAILGLARLGDWDTVRLRLDNELRPLEDQTSTLVASIDQEVTAELSRARSNMRSVQRRIFFIVPTTALLTFVIAAFLGWAVTRQFSVLLQQERISERSRIARELHDTLLQGVISASMQLEVAMDYLAEDSPARPLTARVLQLMRQVADEGRNAVRGFRSPGKDSQQLQAAFVRVPQELGFIQSVNFNVTVKGHEQPLHPVIRNEVYCIGREALVNAFRHSRAGTIGIEIEYLAGSLLILVSDDGCGIDPQVQKMGREGHWGILGMRERAARIGAKLKISSRVEAGTEVKLKVPADIAFESYSLPGVRRLVRLFRHLEETSIPAHGRQAD